MKKIWLLFFCATSLLHAEEAELKTSSGTLYGTLEIPAEITPDMPVVLIVPGSGPTDRDGNNAGLPGKNNCLKYLAESLTKNGIASLRIDKRGVAKSKKAAPAESEMRVTTFVNDLVAWIRYLREEKNYKHIILLGHSEGSLICMLAAQKEKITAFISVAGAGRPLSEIITAQLRMNTPPKLLGEAERIISKLKSGLEVKTIPPLLNSLFRPSVQPYVISLFQYDPAKEISKLKIPILILQGSTDVQVIPDDANLLHKANPDSLLVSIDKMNHTLKYTEGVASPFQLSSYTDPNLPIHEKLMESIIVFVKAMERSKQSHHP